MKKLFILLILVKGLYLISHAQEEKGSVYQFDSLGLTKDIRIVALPMVFSTPETGFGFGGGGQIFLLKKSNIYNARQSNILISAIYTLNQQLLLDIKPQIYIDKGNYFLDMAYKFKIFPNSFWGIGNTTTEENKERYDMTSNELRIGFIKRLPPYLNFGFEFVFEDHNMTDVEEGGLLDSGEILGSDKAIISGLGVIFNLDSRDNIASPLLGHFLQLNARFSSENFGATQSFNKFITDLRTYSPLGKKGLLAFQLYSENIFGDIPFQGQAWFGGGERGRGYFKGRFIDNHQVVAQAEYRFRFHPRWTVAGFVLAGDVADLPGNLLSDIKPSVGGGIRFKVVKDQNTLLRLDFGLGKDGNSGLYFGVNEAF